MSEEGVLFDKEKTRLIQYPADNSRTVYTIPNSVVIIADRAFSNCTKLKNITIPSDVTSIGMRTFSRCISLTNITVPDKVTSIGEWAFYDCDHLASIIIPKSVISIGEWAFSGCTALEDVYYGGQETNWKEISIGTPNESLEKATIHYKTYILTYNANGGIGAPSPQTGSTSYIISSVKPIRKRYKFLGWSKSSTATTATYFPGDSIDLTDDTTLYAVYTEDYYNLGEETYSFRNFSNDECNRGHCFGMSMTSGGYHNGILDISNIGGSEENDLYTLSFSDTVRAPICHYQRFQGSPRRDSTVAGGCWYLYKYFDLSSDWDSVTNYVKNHEYDEKGTLQVGIWKENVGGHAINFLRYKEVNGQPRIYAYDNNFPAIETYFYKGSDGKVYQAPYSTFSGSINCITLRSIPIFFNRAETYDFTRAFYAEADSIAIPNATMYYMENLGANKMVIYEVPEEIENVTIIPLKDEASFTYLEEEYNFGEVTEKTVGTFTLADDEDEFISENNFVIEEKPLTKAYIKNFVASRTVDYKTTITFTADIENAVEGEETVWFVNGKEVGKGNTYTVGKATENFTVQCKTKDIRGNVIESEIETVKVKNGFFDRFIAFFRSLFRMLPDIEQ